MKNNTLMNKMILGLILATNLNVLLAADLVGSGFSYQGELLDNGTPANGEYDILFKAFDDVIDGDVNIFTPEFLNVQVNNGLFNIESIDFGSETFAGKEVFLEVNVRKSADGGDYIALVPRQRIGATPYSVQSDFSIQAYSAYSADSATNATNAVNADNATLATTATTANSLASNGANPDDYLKYDGNSWVASPLDINQTQWTNAGNDNIVYSEGRVGVNTVTPLARLHINSANSEDAFRVQVNGSTKLWVKQDGSTNVFEDLNVSDETNLSGNLNLDAETRQDSDKNGLVKYLVKFQCRSIDTSIVSSFNGTNTPGTISNEATINEGQCRLTFPTSLMDRYVMVSIEDFSGNYNPSCRPSSNNELICAVRNVSTDSLVNIDRELSVVVY